MQQNEQKISDLLEYVSCKAVLGISAIILAALTFWAGIYTHMPKVDLQNAKVRPYPDNIWVNILVLLTVVTVFFVIAKIVLTGSEQKDTKRVHIFAIIVTICVGIIGVVWVTIHTYYPYHDQLQVVMDAMDFKNGIYTDLKGYMEIYPHQLGLTAFYELLFHIWPAYEIIYYFHVIWLMVIVYFTYKVTEELFHNSRISLYSLFMSSCFVPMYFYVNYAYGDLGVAACGMLGIWLITRFCKTEKKRYAVALLAVMTLNCLKRKNTLVVVLAMTLTLLILSLKRLNWQIMLLAALLVILPLASEKAVIGVYESRAGVQMMDGAPLLLHIAMGMQNAYEGPGYYNAYNLMTYVNTNKNAKAAGLIAREYISERLLEMANDLDATKEFYHLKILQQWNEPSFSGEISTQTFETTPRNFVLDIYYGAIQNFLRIFRNYYLFVLYAGALIAVVSKLFLDPKEDSIGENLILVILIGGFLFSILWENKSRYVMPYVMMLIPFAVMGLYELQRYAGLGCTMVRKFLKVQVCSKNN